MSHSPTRAIAPDQAARDRIGQDLGSTLFVEAGAGSGKTTALVDRVVALVKTGTAELSNIAAITFTEKAGAELRDRVRQELEETAEKEGAADVAERCRTALEQLDAAAIGTLHSFAQRLLTENPIEAGLPPRVEVLDEVESQVEFERRWSAFRDQMLADKQLERTILLLIASGVRHGALRALAAAFDDNWDLVEERVAQDEPGPPSVQTVLGKALQTVKQVCDEVCNCDDPADKLCQGLGVIADYLEYLSGLDDELDILEALGEDPPVKAASFKLGGAGKKANWRIDVPALKGRIKDAGEELPQVREQVARACARKLGSYIRRFTLQAAGERRAAGRLEFHDLLVLSRSLLRDPVHGAGVRSRLHGRYRRLLLDEFQDTDPIQIELAVRIAADQPESPPAGAGPWDQVAVSPGHLFVVGDPKQSIYRFRRADISTFMNARERFGPEGDGVVELTANFRSVKPVIDWVNHTFAELMSQKSDEDMPVPSQPAYLGLQAGREEAPAGPSVSVICRDQFHDRSADELRAAEASEVVGTIGTAMRDGWSVGDDAGGWRPARLGDITILIPARTSLPFLEDLLEEAGLAYRAESSSLIYASRAVRDLLMVVRAVDDPTNHLHIVSALRTPLLACGDDDLFRFKVEGKGHWNYLSHQPETLPENDPVLAGLNYLRALHDQRQWRSPSELLDQVVRDRRALELGFAEGRPRDVWRRIRFLIDQARAWSASAGGTLRQYLYWVEQQSAEGARVQEAILPETDDDAVRIMTIHAAKGLEFPITIVSGMSTAPGGRRGAAAEVVFPPSADVGYRFGRHVSTEEYLAYKPIDEQMEFHERIRLLYVACTRAKDHLVVSLCRKARASEPKSSARTNAELLKDGMGALLDELPDAVAGPVTFPKITPVASPDQLLAQEAWEAERREALERSALPTAIAATALKSPAIVEAEPPDPGLQKRPRDMDLPPWLKGRYGTAIGRAVHGVLQTINLATGEGLEEAVAAQCEAEAVPTKTAEVRSLVNHALTSESVIRAGRSRHWREVYTCAPTPDGRLLEGYIDLIYETPEGLVILDYKTAATSDPEDLDQRLEIYRTQGAAYASALETSTGQKIARVTFLFLTPGGPVERRSLTI
ncbi:MAG: UvrD-helicase domain-containing protein [Actinomycetota bacterium]